MQYKVERLERAYFALRVVFSIVVVGLGVAMVTALGKTGGSSSAAMAWVFVFYGLMILGFFWFQKVYLVAYLKGNGVCVSERQFPEVFAAYKAMAESLGLKQLPKLFLIQQGGALNAFAVRFSTKNYIAVYSDVFSVMTTDFDALRFIIGHELGHVKRRHMSKRFWTFPSALVPFLGSAYSRRCEYTCDSIGSSLAEAGARRGLVLLAAGKELYGKVDVEDYIARAQDNLSFAVALVGIFLSHPYLPRRIEHLRTAGPA
ncbi:MAG TPA: M48 family metallopeptidase [Rectinemataceae bacterium]|nr:M48 family metallopeptidase [Rectinemataceae bacterium]